MTSPAQSSPGRARARRWVLALFVVPAALALVATSCTPSKRSGQPEPTSVPNAPTSPATPPGPSGEPATTGGSTVALGVFVRYSGSDYTSISSFSDQLGRTPAIIQGFYGWKNAGGGSIAFPISFVQYVSGQGAMPMITWQPGESGAGLDQPDFSLSALAGGSQDSYIRQWAQAAQRYGKPVYVRLMHEMNDHAYPWAIGVNGNTSPAQYVAAWRHIVDIFRQVGATNVQFVWCAGAKPANSPFQALYPGDAYVQWVSLDGYNRLTDLTGKQAVGWQTMSDIFSAPYKAITSFSDRPVMIAETASVEDPTDTKGKANWITTGFLDEIPQQFPRVKAVLYFDSTGRGFSYPLSSSSQAFDAFKAVASSPDYQATAPTEPLSY